MQSRCLLSPAGHCAKDLLDPLNCHSCDADFMDEDTEHQLLPLTGSPGLLTVALQVVPSRELPAPAPNHPSRSSVVCILPVVYGQPLVLPEGPLGATRVGPGRSCALLNQALGVGVVCCTTSACWDSPVLIRLSSCSHLHFEGRHWPCRWHLCSTTGPLTIFSLRLLRGKRQPLLRLAALVLSGFRLVPITEVSLPDCLCLAH